MLSESHSAETLRHAEQSSSGTPDVTTTAQGLELPSLVIDHPPPEQDSTAAMPTSSRNGSLAPSFSTFSPRASEDQASFAASSTRNLLDGTSRQESSDTITVDKTSNGKVPGSDLIKSTKRWPSTNLRKKIISNMGYEASNPLEEAICSSKFDSDFPRLVREYPIRTHMRWKMRPELKATPLVKILG
jgi:hypothetical protein